MKPSLLLLLLTTFTFADEREVTEEQQAAVLTGGDIVVWGPTSAGNGALDSNGGFDVSGGTLLAVGSSGMAESPDSGSAQAWIAATVSGSAGDEIRITDADGTVTTYVTESVTYIPRAELPVDDLFTREGPRTLAVITCGGDFDQQTRTYSDNVVLIAKAQS
jgi:hypothetical protein